MASLLELTTQGDVGTITDESKLRSPPLMTPQQLYELWERQGWQSHRSTSRRTAGTGPCRDEDEDHITWSLSSFFIGEERVTTQFTGLVMSLRGPARGGVPHDPAGRRGAPRPALQHF